MTRCPKCRKPGLRMSIRLYLEVLAGCRRLDKSGIRRPGVKIVGANWNETRRWCNRCGWSEKREE